MGRCSSSSNRPYFPRICTGRRPRRQANSQGRSTLGIKLHTAVATFCSWSPGSWFSLWFSRQSTPWLWPRSPWRAWARLWWTYCPKFTGSYPGPLPRLALWSCMPSMPSPVSHPWGPELCKFAGSCLPSRSIFYGIRCRHRIFLWAGSHRRARSSGGGVPRWWI